MTRAALAGFAAALLPPEHGGPDPRRLAEQVTAYLDRLPLYARAAVRAGVASLDVAARISTGHSLDRLDLSQREHLLDTIATRPRAATALEGLKTVVLLVAGANDARRDVAARNAATPLARPDAKLAVTPAWAWPSVASCDVAVIGSGAGGAMAARTLARSGAEVVILEEGRRFGVQEFRTGHPLDRFAELYRDSGATACLGRIPIVMPIGRGVGGTTLVNSGTCYRTPRTVLERWRDRAGLDLADPDRFSTYLDEVEATLRVGPVPEQVMGLNGQLMLAGAASLGWRSGPLRRNAPGCGGCCQCAIGCPRNAKFGVHLNALPQACAAGATIVSEARVERVLHHNGRVTGVLARRADGSRFEIRAGRVVVAAGATETPPLLRRSGVGHHPQLGRNLSLHPAVSTAGRFEEEVVAWEGVLQSAAVDEFHEKDGILIEATATPPGMGSMILPGYGRRLLEELDGARHLVTLGAMIADEGHGKVVGRQHSLLFYNLTSTDSRRLIQSIRATGEILFAAGATEVLTGVGAAARDRRELDAILEVADARRLHVAAFHPVGTAAAGADPSRFPLDPAGRSREVRGLWVADASVLPSCPTVNPQVTIMALALAVTEPAEFQRWS